MHKQFTEHSDIFNTFILQFYVIYYITSPDITLFIKSNFYIDNRFVY